MLPQHARYFLKTIALTVLITLFTSLQVSTSSAAPPTRRAVKKKSPPLPLPDRLPSANRLRVQTDYSLSSWDWNHEGDRIPSDLLRAVHRGLYKIGQNGKLEGDLSVSETASMDALTWTFRLKQDVKWSDGVPFTAEHAAAGLLRAANRSAVRSPDSVKRIDGFDLFHAGNTKDFVGVSVESKFVLKIRLNSPDPYFPLKLSDPRTFPAREDLAQANRDYGFNPDHMAFLGPWRVTESRPGLRAKLVANSYYQTTVRGNFREVELWYVPSPSATAALFQRNHIDLALGPIADITAKDVLSVPVPSLVMLARGQKFSSICPGTCMQALSRAIEREKLSRLRPGKSWIPPELEQSGQALPLQNPTTEVQAQGLLPRQLRSLRIGIPADLPIQPDEVALLKDVAKKIAENFSRKLKVSTTIVTVESRGSDAADLFLELHEAHSLSLDSFLSEIEGPQSVTFWTEWSRLTPRSEDQTQRLVDRTRLALEESGSIVPIGYGVRYFLKKPYVAVIPF